MKDILIAIYNLLDIECRCALTEKEGDKMCSISLEITAKYFGTFTLIFDGNENLYDEDALTLSRRICRLKPLGILPHEIFNAKFIEVPQNICCRK